MTYERAERALSRARDDYAHHVQGALNAESDAARKRHARKARTALQRIRDAHHDMAHLGCDLDAWAA
jgi:hypothetical protein